MNADRAIACWLLSCTCATYDSIRSVKRTPKAEIERHRKIIEQALGALRGDGPMPRSSADERMMQWSIERAERCLAEEAAR
jgi:hypothetical protein